MTNGALGSPTAGILKTRTQTMEPSFSSSSPVTSPVNSLPHRLMWPLVCGALVARDSIEMLLVTHWETAWVWRATSYGFGVWMGLDGDLGADFRVLGESEKEEDRRTVWIEQSSTHLRQSRFTSERVSHCQSFETCVCRSGSCRTMHICILPFCHRSCRRWFCATLRPPLLPTLLLPTDDG
jgi:hypothetical protein